MSDIQPARRPPSAASKRRLTLASSHLVVTCATFAALAIFVTTGSQVLPEALRSMAGEGRANNWLQVAFLLNVAIILFGWRRARDLRQALDSEADAERRARESAFSDHLTGLGNRRRLMRALAEASGRQERSTLLLLDLDHFKTINDRFGHDTGDEVLASVAEAIREAAPVGSQLARLGDDEFAILFPPQTLEVTEFARRLLASLSQGRHAGDLGVQVTASVGLSSLHGGLTPEQVLRRADIAMCAAKADGRNRYAWFEQAMEAELQSPTRRPSGTRIRPNEAVIEAEERLASHPPRDEALADSEHPSWPSRRWA